MRDHFDRCRTCRKPAMPWARLAWTALLLMFAASIVLLVDRGFDRARTSDTTAPMASVETPETTNDTPTPR